MKKQRQHMKLELRNITHRYGDFTALDHINITFEAGVYALLGPNGAGKSTMMNLITGIFQPTEGEILYNGISTKILGRNFRNILSYMPQQQGMYEMFSVNRFLAYIAALKGIPGRAVQQEIDRVLALVNLSAAKHRLIREMSGGMKQRVLIAQAIMNDPQIVILDEPTAGLDPQERIRIRNIISQIAINKIVLYATHVVSDIDHLAKKVILLKEGKMIKPVQSPLDLCKDLNGHVFEFFTPEQELDLIQKKYSVSNMKETEQGMNVRVVSKTEPDVQNAELVFPTLEDVYLFLFETEA